MERQDFLNMISRREGIPVEFFEELKIRPYHCFCGRPACCGWQLVHDRFVHRGIADGQIDEAEVRLYKKALGKLYVTTPWIFGVRKEQPALYS